jgi:hypothetical protein
VITDTLESVYQQGVTETAVNVSLSSRFSDLFIGTAISPLQYPILISKFIFPRGKPISAVSMPFSHSYVPY